MSDDAAEIARLRSALTAMHRRAQRAESVADKAVTDYRDTGRWASALASYVWHQAIRERDEARAERDQARRAALEAIADLEEHAADGECAGPSGTGRRGACQECRIARDLRRALLDTPVRPAPVSASEER